MNKRFVLWSGLGAVALLAISGAWILSLPPASAAAAAPPIIAKEEAEATIAALKPANASARSSRS